ncbi:ATP-binding cassette domain-containing protein [Sulfurimonas sp. HSL-1716]|uniref:ABC transporter ATP-binding protein n=1 Tax=Hydrocurvibacter sulfurireducens TaxID=3131937 RepID=UPI0031F99C9C
MNNIIEIASCVFKYPQNEKNTLDIMPLHIKSGEHIFIHGQSGSGKTTFLNVLCGIIEPDHSDIKILQTDFSKLKASQKDRFRADNYGTVFQQFNLMPYLNVKQNIALSCGFSKQKNLHVKDLDGEIKRLLDALNLSSALLNTPAMNLSVGEQQRVAVARALIGNPKIIIADEPTSALDSSSKEKFMELLFAQVEAQGSTLLFVSHDRSLSSYFKTHYDFSHINRALK